MLNSNKILFTLAIFATTLTACDKKDTKTETKTAASTTTTTVTTTSSTASIPAPTPAIAATSNPAAVTTAPVASATASFPSNTNNSIVTQAVTAGTPEATVKNAMDAMMNGTAKQAASYYQVDIPDFDKMLAEQQPQVKQQLKHLEFSKTEYNKDNTKAFIVGKLTTTANPTPQTVSYKLIKVNGDWKLVE